MKTCLKKVVWLMRGMLWLGRGTATVLGLAVMLALVIGLASTALAANGQPFLLGKLTNTATAITRLAGNVAGPAMQVINTNTANNARALDLIVDTGNPPLTVNAAAGKATNLNADKVDGSDAPMWAAMEGNGIPDYWKGLTKTAHPIRGFYELTFNRDVAECTSSATLDTDDSTANISIGFIAVNHPQNSPYRNTIDVFTLDQNAALKDQWFNIIVTC